MSFSDPIGDLITRLRNAQMLGRQEVRSPASKERASVLDVLKREGYIKDYGIHEVRPGIREMVVTLKYVDGAPVIGEISRVSKPGRRVYSAISKLQKIKSGLGISVLSTSQGVMSDHEAREKNVGGEVLFKVF